MRILTFRVRIVIEDVGSFVVFVAPKFASRNATGLEDHRPTPVTVSIELAIRDVALRDGLCEKTSGPLATLTRCTDPAGNVAAEDVTSSTTQW